MSEVVNTNKLREYKNLLWRKAPPYTVNRNTNYTEGHIAEFPQNDNSEKKKPQTVLEHVLRDIGYELVEDGRLCEDKVIANKIVKTYMKGEKSSRNETSTTHR